MEAINDIWQCDYVAAGNSVGFYEVSGCFNLINMTEYYYPFNPLVSKVVSNYGHKTNNQLRGVWFL